ncbi:MAG: hypothetical protein NVS9B3_08400 [Gemmatimonadaceae bacterium]
MRGLLWALWATSALLAAGAIPALAQDNYEIQVYGTETVPAGRTMFELHSNFTLAGRKEVVDGLLPTHHALHETLEITRGLNDWAEIAFYVFTSTRPGQGVQWVGDHIRPRVRVPEHWGWPVGVSVSQEIGYQRREFSVDTWTYELRPIVDRKVGRAYVALNPTFGHSLRGEGAAKGFEFSPNAAVAFDVTRRVAIGTEYYGSVGPLSGFDPLAEQQHQLFAALNIDFGAEWEFNAAYGQALTAGGDAKLVKMIVGRRFAW